MSNSFFRFKKFVIHQDKCGMKVCTDSCLFGAWVGDYLYKNALDPSYILDAGSGTGLLSLMLAQKTSSQIDAIEMEKNSFDQSHENIGASIFKERIQLYYGDMFTFQYPRSYDMIVCNPPFFIDHLKSVSVNKNNAMHNDTGNFKQIFTLAEDNLTKDGILAIMVMYDDLEKIISWAGSKKLFPAKIATIQHSPIHESFRAFILFEKKELELVYENICIRNEVNEYTSVFQYLLCDYYL
ncbi:MAG: methyltransferase [Ginsengibacter sp.]